MSEITFLEAKRRKLGLSQWELARKTGIVQSKLSLIERGHIYVKEEEATVIANALEISSRLIFSFATDRPGKYYAHPIAIQQF